MIPENEIKAASWSSLIRYSIEPLIKLSYFSLVFVPILAILINAWNLIAQAIGSHRLFNDAIAAELATFQVELPLGMFITYLSVLLYIFANVLLQIFCPSKVKEHKSYHRYLGFLSNQYLMEMSWRKRIAADLKEDGQNEQKLALDAEDMRLLNKEFDLVPPNNALGKAVQFSRFSRFLHENLPIIWTRDNFSLKPVRYALLFLYLLSFCLMAFVLFIYTPVTVFSII